MKANERDNILYLEDIALAMDRIHEYIAGLDFQHFKSDYKTVDAVIRNFEIIGEASKNLSSVIKGQIHKRPLGGDVQVKKQNIPRIFWY